MAVFIKKLPALVEDLELGFGATDQTRGGTRINAAAIPFINGGDNVQQALEARPTVTEADIAYAQINGSATEQFTVQDGSLPDQAVSRQQLLDGDSVKANSVDVIVKGASVAYTPSADTDPVNKGYADTLIANKFLGAITGQFIAKSIVDGTTDVTVTVTSGVITSIL